MSRKLVESFLNANALSGEPRLVRKTVHVIRHAQAEHNVAHKTFGDRAYCMEEYRDSPLSFHGQRDALSKKGPQVSAVVSSTSTRAIETANYLYGGPAPPGAINGPRILCTDLARERHIADHVCNHRDTLKSLRQRWPFTVMGEEDMDPRVGQPSETDEAAAQRARDLLDFIKTLPDEHVAVVTHVTFAFSLMHALAPDDYKFWRLEEQDYSRSLHNLEVRTFTFEYPAE